MTEKERERAAKRSALRANERSANRAERVVDAQKKTTNTRAKFGPKKKPAPLVVKSLATGEVKATHENGSIPKPLTRKQASFIRKLRRELGVEIATMPETAREGVRVIDALLQRKETMARMVAAPSVQKPPRREYRVADGSQG